MNLQDIRAELIRELLRVHGSSYSTKQILAAAEELVKYIERGPEKSPSKETAPGIDEPKQASPWTEALKKAQETIANPPPIYEYERWHPNQPPYFPRVWMGTACTENLAWPKITTWLGPATHVDPAQQTRSEALSNSMCRSLTDAPPPLGEYLQIRNPELFTQQTLRGVLPQSSPYI
jgi:hypothetical protein